MTQLPTSIRSLPLWQILAWSGLLLLTVVGCLPWSSISFPNVDLGDMVYQVKRIQVGYVPYRDSFNHHFAGYLLPFYLLSLVVPLTPLWVKVGTVGLNFCVTVLVFLTLGEITGRRSVAFIGALTSATTGWFWGWGAYALNVQSVLAPLLSALIYLIVRGIKRDGATNLYAASFVFGLLLIADQRDLLFGPLLLVAPLARADLRSPAVLTKAIAFSAFAPVASLVLLLQSNAAFDFVEQTLIFPFQHRNSGLQGTALERAAVTSVQLLSGEPIALAISLAGLLMLLVLDGRLWLKWLFVLAIAGACGYVLLGGRPYVNYFLMFGPVVLLLMGLTCEYALLASGSAAVVAATLLVVKAITFLFTAVSSLDQRITLVETERVVQEVATYIREHSSPEDRVLVWGFAPHIYVLSERLNTFRDQGLLSVAGANFEGEGEQPSAVPSMVDEFKRFLDRTPPRIFVNYTVKENRGVCWGKGAVLKNFDYERVPRLEYVRDEIHRAYQSAFTTDGPCDRAEVFIRR